MNKKILAVCDGDKDYLAMLQAYLLKKNPAGFEIIVFDSVKQAVEASREERFDIFLVGEGSCDKSVARVKAQKIFILQEDGLSGITDYETVSKYQSVEQIMRQVLDAFAGDEECTGIKRSDGRAAKLITVYSPDRHKAQSIAALTLAQTISDMEGKKALYISMQPFSGFEGLMGEKYETDITDFMYFVLKHSDKLLYKLDGMKRTVRGADYLPPALDYSDLTGISHEDWKRALELLLCSGGYTHIVADLTEGCQSFGYFLEKSDSIYLLSGADIVSKAMLAQFRELLSKKEMDGVQERCIFIDFPKNWEEYAAHPEQLSFSPLGSYMKGILKQNEQYSL